MRLTISSNTERCCTKQQMLGCVQLGLLLFLHFAFSTKAWHLVHSLSSLKSCRQCLVLKDLHSSGVQFCIEFHSRIFIESVLCNCGWELQSNLSFVEVWKIRSNAWHDEMGLARYICWQASSFTTEWWKAWLFLQSSSLHSAQGAHESQCLFQLLNMRPYV